MTNGNKSAPSSYLSIAGAITGVGAKAFNKVILQRTGQKFPLKMDNNLS